MNIAKFRKSGTPKLRKLGSIKTTGGFVLEVWRQVDRTVSLSYKMTRIVLTPDAAEQLKNLLEEGDSGV